MGKFTWQNGTLVTPARVEVGGQVYDVTPEQYSGQTPLSAENLNQMQDGIYEDIDKNKEDIVALKYNIETNGSEVKTGRQIDGKDEYVKRYKINIVDDTINGNVALGFNLASVTVSEMKGYIVYNNGNIYNLDTNNYRYPDDYTYMYLNSENSDIRIFCATPEHYSYAVVEVYFVYN